MNTCYKIETHEYKAGALDGCVSAAYVIHLEGNGREANIMPEYEKAVPSKRLHVVFNKGFKKCDKGPEVKGTAEDLVDAYLWIFEHALKSGYENVLILEDDFIFEDPILEHAKSICEFVNSRKDIPLSYLLGCLTFILLPVGMSHYKVAVGCGTHSGIYNTTCMKHSLQVRDKITDWDNYVNFNTYKYCYYKPLCYQLFPETDNSKIWGTGENTLINIFIFGILKPTIALLDLGNNIHPGYDIMYFVAKLFPFIALFIAYLVLYLVFYLFLNNRPSRLKSLRITSPASLLRFIRSQF
jgi:hypothetical protein